MFRPMEYMDGIHVRITQNLYDEILEDSVHGRAQCVFQTRTVQHIFV